MQVEHALRQLSHLGHTARYRDARNRVIAQIFEHAADEVSHVDQLHFMHGVVLLDRNLGRVARRTSDVAEPHSTGNVDASVDGMNPARAGIGITTPVVPRIEMP